MDSLCTRAAPTHPTSATTATRITCYTCRLAFDSYKSPPTYVSEPRRPLDPTHTNTHPVPLSTLLPAKRKGSLIIYSPSASYTFQTEHLVHLLLPAPTSSSLTTISSPSPYSTSNNIASNLRQSPSLTYTISPCCSSSTGQLCSLPPLLTLNLLWSSFSSGARSTISALVLDFFSARMKITKRKLITYENMFREDCNPLSNSSNFTKNDSAIRYSNMPYNYGCLRSTRFGPYLNEPALSDLRMECARR
jgi:hypothetical protein